MALTLQGVRIPVSKLSGEITELVRDTEPPLLFHHSSRVYYFAALSGKHHKSSYQHVQPAKRLLQRTRVLLRAARGVQGTPYA
jgi:hypothetical protein